MVRSLVSLAAFALVASPSFAASTACYEATIARGEKLRVRLSSYPAGRNYPAGPAYGVMKVTLTTASGSFENVANSLHALDAEDEEVGMGEEGAENPKRSLEDGFFVAYGVEDDQGHAIIQYADPAGSILRIRGRADYPMTLVSGRAGCDPYLYDSENYDSAKCERKLAPLWRGLRKATCTK